MSEPTQRSHTQTPTTVPRCGTALRLRGTARHPRAQQRSNRNGATYSSCSGTPAGPRGSPRLSREAQAPSRSVAPSRGGPMEGCGSHLSLPSSSPPAPRSNSLIH